MIDPVEFSCGTRNLSKPVSRKPVWTARRVLFWRVPHAAPDCETRRDENRGPKPQVIEMKMQNWTQRIKTGLFTGLILAGSGHFLESISSTSKAPPPPTAIPAQISTPGGLRVLEEACVQCHGLDLIFSQQKSEEAWRESIVLMMWRGAPLLPGEAEMIQDYLVSDFGQNLTPASSPTSVNEISALPEGPGRTLVAEACVACHDLSPVFSRRRSEEEWRSIVNDMVRLGSSLDGGESEAVIDYLSTVVAP